MRGANLLGEGDRVACLLRPGGVSTASDVRDAGMTWRQQDAAPTSPLPPVTVKSPKRWPSTSRTSSSRRTGGAIDYLSAVVGGLQLVPEGAARDALAADYAAMLADEVMVGDALPFDQLMQACVELAARTNAAAGS